MSCSGTKKLPDCRNSPANVPGCRCWACSIASAPSEAPIATGRAAHARPRRRRPGSTPRTSAPAYSGEAEYHSLRAPGATQRDAVRRQRAARDHRGAVVGQPGQLGVLGPVVGDEQRQRGRGPRRRPGSRSARRRRRRARGRATISSRSAPSTLRRVEPRRRLVAVQQQHGLLAERAGRAQRVARVAGPTRCRRRRARARARTRAGSPARRRGRASSPRPRARTRARARSECRRTAA